MLSSCTYFKAPRGGTRGVRNCDFLRLPGAASLPTPCGAVCPGARACLCCPRGKLITQPGWQLEVILTLAHGLLEWKVSKSAFVLPACWRRLAEEHGMGGGKRISPSPAQPVPLAVWLWARLLTSPSLLSPVCKAHLPGWED